ncbi:MAG: hypothetical protein ACR2K3_04290 [Nocardioides sp.]
MNDLLILAPELDYRTHKVHDQLRVVRHRRWLRRLRAEGAAGATTEATWIN